jgi:hypothetical protein
MAKKIKISAKALVLDLGFTAIIASFIFVPNEILQLAFPTIIVKPESDDDLLSINSGLNSTITTSKNALKINGNNTSNNNSINAVSVVQPQKIVHEGVISSVQDPLPGREGGQVAVILPPRNDSSIYSGVITFTASKPVEVQVYHYIANSGNMTNTTDRFGEILTSPFGSGRIAVSLIKPESGEAGVFSRSVPFTGKALALSTLNGEPFIAIYAVNAEIIQVEAPTEELVGTQTGITDYVGLPDFLAILLTGVLTPEQIATLPLSDLSTEDLVKIIDTLSTEDLTSMLNNVSPDEVDNLITKLPPDKGEEIKAIMETKNISKSES